MDKIKKLSRLQLISFSAMAVPIAALGLPFVVHLPAFYKNELGISATAVGLVVMLARFWDVFTDPIFGYLSDNIKRHLGRRYWIAMAVPLQMFCAWYLFMPAAGADVYYLGFWLFFIYISSTMIGISHMSWGAELSPLYHERSRIQGYREFGLIGGMILVLALPDLLGTQNRTETVYLMGLFIIIAAPLCALITLLGTPKEPVQKRTSVLKLNVREALTFIASDSNLRRLLLVAILAAGIAPGITGALYLDTITHVFGLGDERNFLLLVYFVSAVASVPAWIFLSKHIGKHKTLGVSMFYGAIILSGAFILPRGEFWWMFFGLILYGVVYGCGPFLMRALLADFTDQDELKFGKKRTGLCYSLLNMVDKIGIALAVGIAFPLMDLIGFEDGKLANSPETLNWLLVIYVVPSAIAMLVAGLIIWNYPIDEKKQQEIRALLEQNKELNTA